MSKVEKKRAYQKFKKEYAQQFPVSTSSLGEYHAFCTVCSVDFLISHGGVNDIKKHIKSCYNEITDLTSGKPCPPFKIIILDEADSMTYDAQAALRRTMEKQSKNTKFCLICNYISRIIEPLTSRCSKFRFKPLSKPIQGKKLREICEAENINCGEEALDAILKLSEGDMRKSITFLQSVHRLQREDGIRVEDVYEIAGVIPDKIIDNLIQACYGGSYEKLDEKVQDLLQDGYSASQVVNQIFDIIVDRGELTDKQKSAIAERLAVIDKRLCDGADEGLQIMDLFTLTMDQFCTVQN